MYTNIPVTETIQIIEGLLIQNRMDNNKVTQAVNLLSTIMQQNYFQHSNEYYMQNDGLPMGSPLSGTLANIYLNHIEKTYINSNLNKYRKHIIYWHRYVDDILLLFHGTKRQLDNMHTYINSIHTNIKYTLEVESEKTINFLDLTIKNKNNRHSFSIYRKPTHTDQTIHITSNHPAQHKLAAYNHMLIRLNNIPMSDKDYAEELQTIMHIANQNGYKTNIIHRINSKIKHKIQQRHLTSMYTTDEKNNKYIAIEYNKYTSHILKKIFGKHNYIIAHKTSQKLIRKLSTQQNRTCDSGIYKLTCNDCPMFYVGQTGRTFTQRFDEHTKETKHTNLHTNFKSTYAHHLVTQQHTFTDIKSNLKILHTLTKGDMMDRLEELEIYKHRHNTHILNEKTNTRTNKIYDMILYMDVKTQ